MDQDKIFRKIAQACEGLFYVSETDAPIRAFLSKEKTKEPLSKFLSQCTNTQEKRVEEVNFNVFFERLTTEKDWHGEEERVSVTKFQALKTVLEDNLTELKVFKIGRVRKEIFVVGFDKYGRLMGVRTQSVET